MLRSKTTLLLILLCFLPEKAYAVQTGLGDIIPDPTSLTNWVVKSSIGIAGGIAFLLMIYGSFLFLTSAGDPNKLQEATDIIMSAIAGLLLIIFSVFLLELIGIKILGVF